MEHTKTKKQNKVLSILVCAMLILSALPGSVFAEATVVASGDISSTASWTLTSDGKMTISGTGAMFNYSINSNDYYYYATWLPWRDYLNEITSVEIAEGITNIGGASFVNCVNLTGPLTLPSTVKEIGIGAFENCTGLNGNLDLSNVETIKAEAFRSGLDGNLILGNNLTSIERNAFDHCTNLTGTVAFPEGITTITSTSFYHCEKITGVSFGSNLQTIEGFAFSSCLELTGTLNLPETLESIGTYAFNKTKISGSLVIPNNVTTIGTYAFQSCAKLTGTLTLGEKVQTIGGYAFNGCGNLTGSVSFPETLETIGDYAFQNCKKISGGLSFPNAVTTIGTGAFYNCSKIDGNIVFGNSLQTIGAYAFKNLNLATGSLEIPASVTSIGAEAFMNCYALSGTLTVANDAATVGDCAFHACAKNNDILSFFATESEYITTDVTTVDPTPSAVGTKTTKIYCADCSELLKTLTENIPYTPMTSIAVSPASVTLPAGGTAACSVTSVLPANATNSNVVFASGDESIATVAADGTVTGVSAGTTVITVTPADGTNSASATVNVTVYDVTTEETLLLTPDSAGNVNAVITPAGSMGIGAVQSDDPYVATVGLDGSVSAHHPGTATITVFVGDIAKDTVVTVADATVTAAKTNIEKDEETFVQINVLPSGSNVTAGTPTLVSSDDSIVTVNSEGKIVGVGNGTATVTVTVPLSANGKTVSVTKNISVTSTVPVTGITVTNASELARIPVGETKTVIAEVVPSGAANQTLSFSSDTPAVASVDSNGVITANAPGAATITLSATDGSGVTKTVDVTVYDLAANENVLIAKDGTASAGAVVTPAGAVDVAYQTSEPSVATVDPDGTIYAVGTGTANITVTAGDISKTVAVTVYDLAANENVLIAKDGTASAGAVVTPAGAVDVAYQTSEPSVATVDPDGTIHAVGAGTANITVTAEDISKTVRVVVVDADVTVEKTTLEKYETTTVQISVVPDDESVIVGTPVITSSDDSIIAVRGENTLVGVGSGDVIVTVSVPVTVNGQTLTIVKTVPATGTVTISDVDAIVTIGETELAKGETTTVTVQVVPVDVGTIENVTYASSDTHVATVTEEGVVTMVGNGTAVITAVVEINADGRIYPVTKTVEISSKALATFVVEGETVQTSFVGYGRKAVYSGPRPTKDSDKETYTFAGWRSSADGKLYTSARLPAVVDDVTFTAEFSTKKKFSFSDFFRVLINWIKSMFGRIC